MSTLYRETARNRGGAFYDAKFAQQSASKRAVRSRDARVTPGKMWCSVDHYLRLEHSAEPIAGLPSIRQETIYRYINRDKKATGCLHLHLRCHESYRKRSMGSNRAKRWPNFQPKTHS